ncbi:hypothetical protein CIPAW_10G129600, partial [Carya illinoinensis]
STAPNSTCNWIGVSCSRRRQRVTTLNLSYMGLQGTISPHMGNLSFLVLLDLSFNSFFGFIPHEIGHLHHFATNRLIGAIPSSLSNLPMLELICSLIVSLVHSQFNNCVELVTLYLSDNKFDGSISKALFGSLQKLEWLGLGGSILTDLWHLPKLTILALGSNNFKGALIDVDFSENLFFGPIPKSLGNLKYLQELPLGENQLIGQETRDKEQPNFISSLSNCRFLRELYISHNPLDITIPDSIQNLLASLQLFLASNGQIKGLIWLHLGHNNLIGNIPFTFGRLERLQRLYLHNNKIEGLISKEICQLKRLGELYLSNNKISSIILSCISNLNLLEHLMLSSNRLESSVPLNIWSLKNLLFLDLSLNFLGEHLPSNMKTLDTPEYLDLLGNQITGEIPSIIGAFESLSYLDFSNNSFQGGIPQSFGNLKGLDILNLSYNNLSVGEIPSSGPFVNFTAKSFSGNSALCGSRIFGVSPCPTIPTYQQPKTKHILFKCILPVIASIIIFVILVYLPGRCRRINMEIPTSLNALHTLERRIISYQELFQGTNKFCESNLLGAGGFGSVYKGILSDRTIVAIKVLRTIRHRNLVKVITTCTNPEFRALVLEYMSKGNLERWLYSYNYCLDLLQRINIMVDVASTLDYLHHGQSKSILHCDLKPTNILLDEDMVAHVANFGIAKILVENKDATHTKTLRTIGYIAPEFGFEGMVSIKSDVYSFGIVLLEMVTRKKLTDDMFAGDFTLRQLVNASVPDRMVEVVDEGLLRIEDGRDTIALQSILSSILDLGLRCSKELPNTRMDIKDVAVKLNKIKSTFCEQEQGY